MFRAAGSWQVLKIFKCRLEPEPCSLWRQIVASHSFATMILPSSSFQSPQQTEDFTPISLSRLLLSSPRRLVPRALNSRRCPGHPKNRYLFYPKGLINMPFQPTNNKAKYIHSCKLIDVLGDVLPTLVHGLGLAAFANNREFSRCQ